MKIYLKSGQETKILTIKHSVYFWGIKSKQLVDKMFNKMQCLSQVRYTNNLHSIQSLSFYNLEDNDGLKKKKMGGGRYLEIE